VLRPGRKPREVSSLPRFRDALEFLARRPGSAQKIALRARIILAALDGQRSVEIACALAIHENTAWKWRTRWARAEEDLRRLLSRLEPDDTPCPLPKLAEAIAQEILNDAPRSGAPPRVHG
jgi:hypothetical protein